jgi:hypothetical protein
MQSETVPEGDTMQRTTVDLSKDLWKRAKIRAMDEGTDLKSVITAALEAYLKTKIAPKKGGA